MAPAVLLSLFPKSAGSIARISDDRYAPKDVRRATIAREASTLAQVGIYAASIERGMTFLKKDVAKISQSPAASKVLTALHKLGMGRVAEGIALKGERSLLVSAMRKLEKNEPLFLAGLAFTSNISAEMISRKLSPRNVWKKPGEEAVSQSGDKMIAQPAPIQATLVDGAKGREIPVEIEICEVMPVKRAKSNPRFEAAPKTQSVQFASRSGFSAPAVNPFQLRSPSPSVASPVARTAFSV